MVELLVAVAVVGLLAAVLVGSFGRARSGSRRSDCDSHIKALVIATDAFRQERGRFPRNLAELTRDYVRDASLLRCPDDPNPASTGYEAFYVVRASRNDPRFENHFPKLPNAAQQPSIVCPFHEANGVGVQGFGGLQTHQFGTRPAKLVSAGATEIVRPGNPVNVIPASAGMELRGGDLIKTDAGGSGALIEFFDGSTCQISPGSELTVLQSFMQSGDGTLYTLVKQTVGNIAYTVHHGSKFDVSTPTATAGALGTEFNIVISGTPGTAGYVEKWKNTSIAVQSDVFCARPHVATIIPRHVWVNVGDGLAAPDSPMPGGTPSPTAGPTPGPTASPTPSPIPSPTASPTPGGGSDDDDDDDDDGNNGHGNDDDGRDDRSNKR